jgi:hypothetical protein
MTSSPFNDGRRDFGVGIVRSPRRYAPVNDPFPFFSRSAGSPLEDHLAAMLAGARPEVDDPVRRPDGLLVMLDDDDGVAEIAEPPERREQLAVVALVQTDRRLVEHVEHAPSGSRQSAWRGGCAALRHPTACAALRFNVR